MDQKDSGTGTLGKAFKEFTLYSMIVNGLRNAVQEAVQTVKELDKYLTEQAMVTGKTREETYGLLKSYQDLAAQCGATTKEIAQVSTEYLKQGKTIFGVDYFQELLERIRSIRASERRIWQKITDIYAECSIDYDKNAITTKDFYAMIQNRFHYAITGQTAAEIIYYNADHNKENMGLTTWKNSPNGRILKSDVTIAKNYLKENEIKSLERTVSSYFDYIESLIERQNVFNMEQFAESVNKFLAFMDYRILPDKGNVSTEQAKIKAEQEYDIFNKTQIINSDFDIQLKRFLNEID
jgi:hypothetical protein